jgi:single-stranded DNA-binding protein
MNNLTLVGNVVSAPEFRTFESGSEKATLQLAVTVHGKEKRTLWVLCEFWNETVKNLKLCNVGRGTLMGVSGSLAQSSYVRQVGDAELRVRRDYCKVERFSVLTPKRLNGEELQSLPSPEDVVEEITILSDGKNGKKKPALAGVSTGG